MLLTPRFAAVEQAAGRYPDPMGQVQDAVRRGEYGQGLVLFRALLAPTALELRLGGICLLHEGHRPEASVRLRQAIAAGDGAAGIYLSALHLIDRELDEARAALDRLNPEALPADEAALWFRERARVGWLLGDGRNALLAFGQQAWDLAADASLGTQVSVATLMGSLLDHFGEHARALAYLDFTAGYGHARQQQYTALCLAGPLIGLGRFEEAGRQLDRVDAPSLAGLRDLERAALFQGQLDWSAARLTLLELLPTVGREPGQEFRTLLGLLTVAMVQGDDALAQRSLLRAEHLARNTYDRLFLDHRAGQWLRRQGNVQGVVRLLRAAEGLEGAGHLAKATAVWLALAEAQPDQRSQHLRHAAQLAAQVGISPSLTPEWPLLPQTLQHLLALPETAFERLTLLGEAPVRRLSLKTLGEAGLWLDGERVRFRLGRAVEVLCYLRRSGAVTLKDVQRDLFPDVPVQRSKNYFHQVRVDIAARVPGLVIGFDAAQGRYRLQGEAELVWDVEGLEAALRQGRWPQPAPESVVFLPAAESSWAQGERERLSRWITQVGLETMEDWFQTGQYDKCISLADRLLPLDPLDEGLHTFLLNATYHVRGRAAARLLSRESAATFLREVGEVPPFLERLAGQWGAVN